MADFMKKLTKQYLLKMSPELIELIDAAFSEFLKETGQYITKAEYVRNILETHCKLVLEEKKVED
jgi:predicted DNA-binding protein